MKTRYAVTAGVTLGVALSFVAGSGAVSGKHRSPAVRARPSSAQAEVLARPHLSVFRRAVKADDPVPTDIATGPIDGDGVADVTRARRVRISHPAWIAPAQGRVQPSLCFFTGASLSCPPVADVTQNGASIAVSLHANHEIVLTGIASDSVQQVTAVFADGSTQVINAADNFLWATLPHGPKEVDWIGPDGPQVVHLPTQFSQL